MPDQNSVVAPSTTSEIRDCSSSDRTVPSIGWQPRYKPVPTKQSSPYQPASPASVSAIPKFQAVRPSGSSMVTSTWLNGALAVQWTATDNPVSSTGSLILGFFLTGSGAGASGVVSTSS